MPKSEQQAAFRSSRSITALQKQHSAVQVTPLSPSKIQIKVKPSAAPTRLSKASEVFAAGRISPAMQNLGGLYVCNGCGGTGTMAETTREHAPNQQRAADAFPSSGTSRHPLSPSMLRVSMRKEAGQQCAKPRMA